MSEEITPEEEPVEDIFDEDDPETDTPAEGNKEDSDKVSDEAFLAKVNEIEGRNYKSVEAYEKTVKERQKAFAQKKTPVEQVETPPEKGDDVVLKSLYLKANPEASHVWEDVEQQAKTLNKTPYELYEGSAYFKGEAKAKALEEQNKKKVNNSSNIKPVDKETVIETEEDLENASEKEKMDFFDKQVKKERAGLV